MFTYKTEKNIRELLSQVDAKLFQIEVKGDSVQNLFSARVMLKELFSNLEEIEEEKKEE
jgi:hypothetical protein